MPLLIVFGFLFFGPGRFRHRPKSKSRLTSRRASWISQRPAPSKRALSCPKTPQLSPCTTQPSFSAWQWKSFPSTVSSLQASLSSQSASAPRDGPTESAAATAQSCLHWWRPQRFLLQWSRTTSQGCPVSHFGWAGAWRGGGDE